MTSKMRTYISLLSVLISDVHFSFRMSTECPLVDTKMRIGADTSRTACPATRRHGRQTNNRSIDFCCRPPVDATLWTSAATRHGAGSSTRICVRRPENHCVRHPHGGLCLEDMAGTETEGTVTWLYRWRARREEASRTAPLYTIKDVGDACGLPGPVIMQLVPRTWTDEGWNVHR